MNRSRFTDEQISYALKLAEQGTPVKDVCRQFGISEATFYVWRKKFAGLGPLEVRELRQLRKEKLYAEILSRISDRMLGCVEAARADHREPTEQLLAALLSIYELSLEAPHETRIIMRELLDSDRRASEVHSWYLKPFLDALIDITRTITAGKTPSRTDALTQIYPILGAMSYSIVSDVVLQQMYGKANYSGMQRRYPDEIRRQVRDLKEDLA